MGKKTRLQCVGISVAETSRKVKQRFPGLKTGEFVVTSCPGPYNCIHWAAADDLTVERLLAARYERNDWWWPHRDGYWPEGVPYEETLEAFVAMFEAMGYSPCDDVSYEHGFEKVAIFIKNGVPSHAARQIGPSKWTSKLGKFADITHRLLAIEGDEYGKRAVTLKRPS
jgi:hypothetical protein